MAVFPHDVDYGALSPAQKMGLAEQELEASSHPLTSEQMQEIKHRLAAYDAKKTIVEPWEKIYERLK